MRVVYILGLAHTGTTIIDRILSCYPGTIGLGEAEHLVRKINRGTIGTLPCPCGATTSECSFWGGIVAQQYATPAAFFAKVVETSRAQGYSAIVDSSKSVGTSAQYLRLLAHGDISDLSILRVVRDPRGWVHSIMRREDGNPNDEKTIRGLFYRWLLGSIKLDQKARRRAGNLTYVWYDKLILEREEDKLASLIGLPSLPTSGISLVQANQHAIAGNKFAFSKKREKLTYDTRWMQAQLIEDLYAALPAVRSYYYALQQLHLSKEIGLPITPDHSSIAEMEAYLELDGSASAQETSSEMRIGSL